MSVCTIEKEDLLRPSMGLSEAVIAKDKERAEIEQQVQEFLAGGGQITVLETTCKGLTDKRRRDYYYRGMAEINTKAMEAREAKVKASKMGFVLEG